MLSEQEIDAAHLKFAWVNLNCTEHRDAFARAIESAATAPLLTRIAELERLRSEDHSHAIDLASEIERMTRELEETRRKSQEDNYEFNRAINFAIDQGSEACHFLSAWREGDTSGWPEFNAAIKEQT